MHMLINVIPDTTRFVDTYNVQKFIPQLFSNGQKSIYLIDTVCIARKCFRANNFLYNKTWDEILKYT